ncbi:MAG: FKBP-type peptidyl-prolyl cis-trans isomerase [Bacteroidota bacterium]|nr:FKBP-type peptidyl-prolyl cis-trans isomerase [Bacteroidota bacterium]MDP3146473.1 FKBP-type peptidyl-prolyl cis-trans isomerase [Bacteroidota bacterium]
MIHNFFIYFVSSAFCGCIFLVAFSCESSSKKEKPKNNFPKTINEEKLKKQFETANKQVIQKEIDEMDYYVKTHKMPFVNTTSGIRYYVYKPSAHGDSIKDGEEIVMNFVVSLLDGTECYSSKTEGKKTFIVGNENIESGIHKGVKYLKHGDKALLLIPSHLAHGLLGDFNKIPPQMPIIYDIEIY